MLAPALEADLPVLPEQAAVAVELGGALLDARQEHLIERPEALLQLRLADPPEEPSRQRCMLASRRLDQVKALRGVRDRDAVGNHLEIASFDREVEPESDIDGLAPVDRDAEILTGGDPPSDPPLVSADLEAGFADRERDAGLAVRSQPQDRLGDVRAVAKIEDPFRRVLAGPFEEGTSE